MGIPLPNQGAAHNVSSEHGKAAEQDGGSIVLEDMQMGCVAGASFPGGGKKTKNAAFDF